MVLEGWMVYSWPLKIAFWCVLCFVVEINGPQICWQASKPWLQSGGNVCRDGHWRKSEQDWEIRTASWSKDPWWNAHFLCSRHTIPSWLSCSCSSKLRVVLCNMSMLARLDPARFLHQFAHWPSCVDECGESGQSGPEPACWFVVQIKLASVTCWHK